MLPLRCSAFKIVHIPSVWYFRRKRSGHALRVTYVKRRSNHTRSRIASSRGAHDCGGIPAPLPQLTEPDSRHEVVSRGQATSSGASFRAGEVYSRGRGLRQDSETLYGVSYSFHSEAEEEFIAVPLLVHSNLLKSRQGPGTPPRIHHQSRKNPLPSPRSRRQSGTASLSTTPQMEDGHVRSTARRPKPISKSAPSFSFFTPHRPQKRGRSLFVDHTPNGGRSCAKDCPSPETYQQIIPSLPAFYPAPAPEAGPLPAGIPSPSSKDDENAPSKGGPGATKAYDKACDKGGQPTPLNPDPAPSIHPRPTRDNGPAHADKCALPPRGKDQGPPR